MEFNILKIDLSVRQDTVACNPEDPNDFSCSEEKFLVAHILYEYLGKRVAAVGDLQSIAKREIDSSGLTTSVTVSELKYDTQKSLEEAVKSIVESKIKSDSLDLQFNSHVDDLFRKAQINTCFDKRSTATGRPF